MEKTNPTTVGRVELFFPSGGTSQYSLGHKNLENQRLVLIEADDETVQLTYSGDGRTSYKCFHGFPYVVETL